MGTKKKTRERGSAAVEFALVVPILTMFLFGIIEYGNFFMTDLKASNAAMVGARAAAIGDADWQAQALASAGTGYSVSKVGCTTTTTATQPARSVAVTVSKNYDGLLGDIIPTPSKITARGVVRCE